MDCTKELTEFVVVMVSQRGYPAGMQHMCIPDAKLQDSMPPARRLYLRCLFTYRWEVPLKVIVVTQPAAGDVCGEAKQ